MICSAKMHSLNSLSCRSCNRISLLPAPKPTKSLLSLFSSLIKTQNTHPSFLLNYLIENFNLSEQRALLLSKQYNHINSHEKPQSVLDFLQALGFSQAHIRSAVHSTPQILFSDIDKTLKPKIELFQQLGLVGSHLGEFLSKNSLLLAVSLEKRLIPNIEILRKILVNDKNGEDLIRVIKRCSWVVSSVPKRRLLSNIQCLESCGIVGSQLSMLLKVAPRLFTEEESKLGEVVSRTLSMGFFINSRMFVHGLCSVSCMSEETFERKVQLLRSFGFSKDECMDMFRKLPSFLKSSEEKLKLGLDFFLNKMLITKEVLLHNPACLGYSLEGRVIPRYKVLQIVESKALLNKVPNICSVLYMTEDKFLEKFVARFRDDAEELLVAYKGHKLDSSCSASSEEDSEEKES